MLFQATRCGELAMQDDFRWKYLNILDAVDLSPVSKKTTSIIILGAYEINSTCLIDNILITT